MVSGTISYALFFVCFAGLPPRYRDSVRAITPGLPLFLYNYTTHQLHGIFEVCYLYIYILFQLLTSCQTSSQVLVLYTIFVFTDVITDKEHTSSHYDMEYIHVKMAHFWKNLFFFPPLIFTVS